MGAGRSTSPSLAVAARERRTPLYRDPSMATIATVAPAPRQEIAR
jgi:hypothetical protein